MIGTLLIFIKTKTTKIIIGSLSFAAGVMFSVSILDLIPEAISLLKYKSYLEIPLIAVFMAIGMLFSISIDKYIPKEQNANHSGLFRVGLISMFAIIMHNIPEGIAVALPVYHVTGKKRYAMLYAALSGLSEPIGALVGLLIFSFLLPQMLIGAIMAAVAGIMIYLAFDTLLPLAKEYGDWHLSLTGIISGILFIWFGLIIIG